MSVDVSSADDSDEVRRIVDAAWDVLHRSGYDNLKIHVVARLAGVSIGSFYRHFGGQRELMTALLRDELTRATAILDRLTASGTPAERVQAWVDAVVSLRFGRRAGPRAQWITSLVPEIRQLVLDDVSPDMDTSRPLREAIGDGVRDGAFPGADPERDAFLIQSLCSRLDEDPVPAFATREEAVRSVAGFVLAALTNPIATTNSVRPARDIRRDCER